MAGGTLLESVTPVRLFACESHGFPRFMQRRQPGRQKTGAQGAGRDSGRHGSVSGRKGGASCIASRIMRGVCLKMAGRGCNVQAVERVKHDGESGGYGIAVDRCGHVVSPSAPLTRGVIEFSAKAGLLARGSMPVLPPSRKIPVASGRGCPLTVAGAADDWAPIGSAFTSFPNYPRCFASLRGPLLTPF